jgi:hypothetical protein
MEATGANAQRRVVRARAGRARTKVIVDLPHPVPITVR